MTTDRETAIASLAAARQAVEESLERVEAAKRERDAAFDAQRAARSRRRSAVGTARKVGLTFREISGVLGVSLQRAQALASKDPDVKRR